VGASGYFSGNGRKRQGSATGKIGNGGKSISAYDSEKHIEELENAKSAKAGAKEPERAWAMRFASSVRFAGLRKRARGVTRARSGGSVHDRLTTAAHSFWPVTTRETEATAADD
jgi:hypothetical protein